MSARERKHHSLAARVFHSSLMGSIVLGLVALAVGLGLYTLAVSNRYISQAFSLSRSAAGIIEVAGDIRPLSDAVMTAYREQTDGERAQTMTDAYHARFSALAEREDYRLVRAILTNFSHSSDADAIYLAMYDRDTCAMVYLCDPDENPETVMMPGDWDPVTRKGMEHFLTWDGKGMLYAIENTERYGWLCTGGAPIRGADGEVAAFVLSDITLTNVWDGVKTFLVQFLLALAAATLLVGFVSTGIAQFVDNFVFATIVSLHFFGWSWTQVIFCSITGLSQTCPCIFSSRLRMVSRACEVSSLYERSFCT